MLKKLIIISIFIFLTLLISASKAQIGDIKANNVKVKLIEFTNKTAKFEVPDDKAWQIICVFPQYLTIGEMDDFKVGIEKINETVCTNLKEDKVLNINPKFSNILPIFLPSKTTISFIIFKDNFKEKTKIKCDDKVKAFISIIEFDI